MEDIKDEFRKDFCKRCGSQRCFGQNDELEYCERFKNLIDNLGKTTIKNHKMGPKSKLPSKYYEDKLEETQSKRDIDKSEFIIKHMILPNKVDDKLECEIIDGYEFDKVENNKIILKPIKPKYPKTYVECCEVIANSKPYAMNEHYTDVNKLLQTLQTLFICRNAYWKIAGEEMGLGKPWEPNWTTFEGMPAIFRFRYNIVCDSIKNQHCLLVFPTEEMRDTFYKNFKDLIEECKELL